MSTIASPNKPVTTKIDAALCNGCGLCVKVCPDDTLSMRDDKAVVTGTHSLGCGQCAAVCPTGAVTVGSIDPDALQLETVAVEDRMVRTGDYDVAGLVRLMRSRRSCRNYKDKPVAEAMLRDLVKIGQTAASGTNSQLWTFTIVPDRASVMKVGDAMRAFFVRLNRLSANPAARLAARVFMKDVLGQYYREYHGRVETALTEYAAGGRERLFHGAPALIVIAMRPGASCPCEDALLATQNILLAAHAMGLGTCLIGFGVEAMRHEPRIKRVLGIPREETVYSVIALGWPAFQYARFAGRRKVPPRWFRSAA